MYVKVNGEYIPVLSAYIKVNGEYVPALNIYNKVNGVYEVTTFNQGGGGGEDPSVLLNSISISNSEIYSSSVNSEINDLSGNRIIQTTQWKLYSGSRESFLNRSYSVRFPKYTPNFNQSDEWFRTNDITIAGSTVSLISKTTPTFTNTGNSVGGDSNVFNLLKNNCLDNLSYDLVNNSIILNSKDNSKYYFNSDKTSSNLNRGSILNRKGSSFGDVNVGLEEYSTYYNKVKSNWRWSIEVKLNYAITFIHNPSGQTRTINKTITFRSF